MDQFIGEGRGKRERTDFLIEFANLPILSIVSKWINLLAGRGKGERELIF